MPTKPKQQMAVLQSKNRDVVVAAFREFCAAHRLAPNEAAAREFTADMDGLFEGTPAAELLAFIRSDPLFQR